MKITKTSPITGTVYTIDLPITEEQYNRWMNGDLVQDVFETLSDSQREFLISGITEEEWNEYIVEQGYDEEECVGCGGDSVSLTEDEMAYVTALKNQYNKGLVLESYYEVRYKDIDPDTGDVTSDTRLAVCESQDKAEWVKSAIASDYFDNASDPNRDFYINFVNE
jgi:hypothetical protein